MMNVKQMFNRISQVIVLAAVFCFSVKAEQAVSHNRVAQNFVAGDVARAASKLYIAPFIASHIKQIPLYASSISTHVALKNSVSGSFNSQTRADAGNSVYHEPGQPVGISTEQSSSLVNEIVSGEVSIQTEILTREALAHILQYLKLATIEQNGAYRLAMDYFGTSYEVASDISNSYEALHANGKTECAGVYAESTALGFITAYMNLFLSGLVAGYPKNPLLQTMVFLAAYMFLDPIFKRMIATTVDMDQCPGASELYGFGGDFCYFATGVVPDNMNFANQVH